MGIAFQKNEIFFKRNKFFMKKGVVLKKKNDFLKTKKNLATTIFFFTERASVSEDLEKNWSLYYWTNDFSKNFLINNSFLRFCWPKDLEKTIGYFTDWKILLNEWFYWTNYSTKITNDCTKQSFTKKTNEINGKWTIILRSNKIFLF